MYSHAVAIIPVNDVQESIEFNVDKLGFQCTFQWEEPTSHVALKFNEKINIHLSKSHNPVTPGDYQILTYIFVYDVDQVYVELTSKRVDSHNPPTTWDYGIRDFAVRDNTGHLLSFGMGV